MKIRDIRVFIPCKDYEESQSFYSAFGFDCEGAGENLTICTKNGCTFFLQKNYYSEEFCKNLMLQLIVEDIDQTYACVSKIPSKNMKYSEVKREPWGKVVYLWGPSGELWHLTELNNG